MAPLPQLSCDIFAELLQNTEFPGINNQSALVGDGSAAACFANGVAAAGWT